MDTSETYIKMCDCPEIQRVKPFDPYHTSSVWHDDSWGGFTWLPRQDQLQEMVVHGTLNKDGLGSLLSRFWVFCSCKYMGEPTFWVFTSMEQLWLAFVMKEKYNKTWDGERWSDKEGQVGVSD